LTRVKGVRSVFAVAVALVLLSACGGGGGHATLGRRVHPTTPTAGSTTDSTTATTQAKPLPPIALVAKATVRLLNVYDAPNAPAPARQLENPWVVDPAFPDQTVPQVFLVQESRPDGWVRVLLPVRPNGSSGWVRKSDVEIAVTDYHVRVDLAAHTITVTKGDQQLYSGPVAIGTAATPTPPGEYYVRVKIKAVDPTTVYGPYAWGLSSHSDALDTFNGGDAEIGIHGNNDASVLGHDVTHGCVRMDNGAITMLSNDLPLGTPVDIVS
jgi:lipoprotein-anchoring transpeptidase ErfK/SrfK